jgi:hypothetical protein
VADRHRGQFHEPTAVPAADGEHVGVVAGAEAVVEDPLPLKKRVMGLELGRDLGAGREPSGATV